MFTEQDLENDFGPQRKTDFLKQIHLIQDQSGYCAEDRESRGQPAMITIGIYDGDPPPSDIPFRTGESE